MAYNDSVSGSIESGDVAVTTTWTSSEWGSFVSGFVVSNKDDVTTAGYMNPFSSFAAEGANGSEKFAVYNNSTDSVKFKAPVDLESIMICNNTYAALSMKNGDDYAKKFAAGDFFKLKVNVYSELNTKLGTETFFLADFQNGKSLIVSDWTKCDLSSYSGVSYLKFEFESSDNGDWGMNTPAYFCLDNISYYEAE